VADSSPESEYEECRLKGTFLTRLKSLDKERRFQLVETLLYDGSGFPLLELHLDRMGSSARYFGRRFNRRRARQALARAVENLDHDPSRPRRFRLLLDEYGEFHCEHRAFEPPRGKVRIALYHRKTDPAQRWLYHKTTRRPLYAKAFAEAQARGLFDYLFTNSLGQVTEGTRCNVYVQIGSVLYTPPVRAGLLPGVYRRFLLRRGEPQVRQRMISPDELARADRLWVSNAICGLVEAELVEE